PGSRQGPAVLPGRPHRAASPNEDRLLGAVRHSWRAALVTVAPAARGARRPHGLPARSVASTFADVKPRWSSLWLPVLVGCSFVDYFHRFRGYEGSEGGESEAVSPSEALGERDAARSADDPMRAADAAAMVPSPDDDGGQQSRGNEA